MRGQDGNQGFMFTYICAEQRVPEQGRAIVDPDKATEIWRRPRLIRLPHQLYPKPVEDLARDWIRFRRSKRFGHLQSSIRLEGQWFPSFCCSHKAR